MFRFIASTARVARRKPSVLAAVRPAAPRGDRRALIAPVAAAALAAAAWSSDSAHSLAEGLPAEPDTIASSPADASAAAAGARP